MYLKTYKYTEISTEELYSKLLHSKVKTLCSRYYFDCVVRFIQDTMASMWLTVLVMMSAIAMTLACECKHQRTFEQIYCDSDFISHLFFSDVYDDKAFNIRTYYVEEIRAEKTWTNTIEPGFLLAKIDNCTVPLNLSYRIAGSIVQHGTNSFRHINFCDSVVVSNIPGDLPIVDCSGGTSGGY